VRGRGERRRHALLRRHEFDAGPQPAAQRLDRCVFCLDEMLGQLDKLFHLAPIDRLVEILSGRKVPIQCPDPDAGTPGHGLQARLRTALAKHRLCRLQHSLAIADCVRARLAFFNFRLLRHRSAFACWPL
jgi:hypothetical protein